MYKRKPGYILIVSLTLICLFMFMVTYIVYRGSAFVPYAKIAINKQQALLLAQSGIEIGISQLVAPKVPPKKEEATNAEQQSKKKSKDEQIKDALGVMLPHLNRWQEFKLTEQTEGIDATIKICIMSEQGKIDLNAFYNFDKHQFRDAQDGKKTMQEVFTLLDKMQDTKGTFDAYEKFVKSREYALNDATELLLVKEFAKFGDAQFYDPSGGSKKVYLTDLFTVWTGQRTINPWMLSRSCAALMGIDLDPGTDMAQYKKKVAQSLKQFKLNNQWQSDWDKTLKPLYGKEYKSIPKSLQPLLSSSFEAEVFSILSYATVDQVTQRVLAVVEAPLDGQKEAVIKKVYWL